MNTLHSKFERRLVVECTASTLEPLHVGTGRETETMQDSKSRPIIPGSSIKGSFRAHLTRLLKSLPDKTRKGLHIERIETDEAVLEKFQEARDSEAKFNFFKELGVIDKLFGASGFAAPLKYTDATISHSVKTIRRTHVRIDVNRDKAVRGALFDMEAAPENSQFNFKIIYEELSDPLMKDANTAFYELILKPLCAGIEMYLGGLKSRGYGLCTIKANKIQVYTPEDLALAKEPKSYQNYEKFKQEIVAGEA